MREAQRAVAIDPEYGLAHAVLAAAWAWTKALGTGDDSAMRNHAERAMQLSPNDAQALTFAGQATMYLGEYQKALVLLKKALRISPGIFAANYFCGAVLIRLQRWDEAIEHLEIELRVAPDNRANYIAHMYSALAHAGAGRWDEALRHIDRSLALAPNNDTPLMLRGIFLSHVGNKTDAGACFVRLSSSLRARGKDWSANFVRTELGHHAVAEELVTCLDSLWDVTATLT